MARSKDLEALLRNANGQSPNARRITKRSFLMFALPAINLGDFINHLGSFGSHTFRSTSGIRCVPCQHLSGPPRRPELNSEEAGGGRQQRLLQVVERSPPWMEWNWSGGEE